MSKTNPNNKTQNQISSVINYIPSAILWVNQDLKILETNDLFLSIIGKSSADVIGTNLADYPFKNLNQYFSHLDLFNDFEVKIIDHFEVEEANKTMRFYVKEVKSEHSFMIMGIDISHELYRMEAHEEARRYHEENTRFMLIGQIASGVAHEINNPLAIISGFLFNMKRVLEKNEAPVDKQYFIDKISKSMYNVDRIAMIIRGLKYLSKNDINSPFEDVHIKEIVNHALDLCSEKFKTSGVKLIIDETSPEMIVHCRQVPLTQVVLNLLMNAYEAVEDSVEKWVRVSFTPNEKGFTLSVIDSGPGVPKEIRSKIMQPFFTTKIASKRVGLGLSTSRIIVQDHSAELFYDENSLDTKFSIVF